MGTLYFGSDCVALGRDVHAFTALESHSFGPRAWGKNGIYHHSIYDLVADGASTPNPVICKPLWQHCLKEILQNQNGELFIPQLQALDGTLLKLAGEGVDATELKKISASRRLRVADASLLEQLAELLGHIENRCENAGLMPRTRAIREGYNLKMSVSGILCDWLGRIIAPTLMRAVREQPQATIGILCDGEGTPEDFCQTFLDLATREFFGVEERQSMSRLSIDVRASDELSTTLWRDATEALCERKLDIYVARNSFAQTLSAAFAIPSTCDEPADPLLSFFRWLEQPLLTASALLWLRTETTFHFDEERKLLACGQHLAPHLLPFKLRKAWTSMPPSPCSIVTIKNWLRDNKFEDLSAQLIEQCQQLQLHTDVSNWGRLLGESLERENRSATPARIFSSPYLPSGKHPVLWLEPHIFYSAPTVFSRSLTQDLVKLGLVGVGDCAIQASLSAAPFHVNNAESLSPCVLSPVPPPTCHLAITRVSVSEIIDYIYCPYRFYLRRQLRLEPPREEILSPLTWGIIVHQVAEKALRPWIGVAVDENVIAQACAAVPQLLAHTVATFRAPFAVSSQDHLRVQQLSEHLRWYLQQTLTSLSHAHGHIEALELPIELTHDDLVITGRIDRVDRVLDEAVDQRGLWDLKSGSGAPSLADPAAIQLYIYALALGFDTISFVAFAMLQSRRFHGVAKRSFHGLDLTTAPLAESLRGAKAFFEEAVAGIKQHEFSPLPREGEKTCDTCSMAAICRFTQTENLASTPEPVYV